MVEGFLGRVGGDMMAHPVMRLWRRDWVARFIRVTISDKKIIDTDL